MSVEPPRLIVVDDDTVLRPVFEVPPATVYAMIDRNRAYLGRFLQFATADYSLNDAEGYADQSRANWGKYGEQAYAVIHVGDFAGTIGLHRYGAPNRAFEIGYWLDEALQGRGIMTRCVLKLTDTAFQQLNANQVVITADVANNRSRGVADRLGFSLDGVTRQWAVNAAGELSDMASYSMLRSEWEVREK